MQVTILIPSVRELSKEFMESIKGRRYIILKNEKVNPYYKLITMCETEYFYFLEDDDLLAKSFPNDIDLPDEYDGMTGSYLQHQNMEIDKTYKTRRITDITKENFQLGQVIFRNNEKVVNLFKDALKCEYCTLGCTHNDYFIYNEIRALKTEKFFFIQGTKGDNISTNLEKSFCKGCKYNKGF